MGFASSLLSWLSPQPSLNPGHWKREEEAYLTSTGAMPQIKADPMARTGYAHMQNPDGSGLLMSGTPEVSTAKGSFSTSLLGGERLNVDTSLPPQIYGEVLTHELGHAGSSVTPGSTYGTPDEEKRQRLTDYYLSPPRSMRRFEAPMVLFNDYGMQPSDFADAFAKYKNPASSR